MKLPCHPQSRRVRRTTSRTGPHRRCRLHVERLEQRLAPAGQTIGSAEFVPLAARNQWILVNPTNAVSGTISDANQDDVYAVHLNAGDQLYVDSYAPTGSDLRNALRIFDQNGNQLSFQETPASY